MPGPFPGMDPYIENRWGDFHVSLIGRIRDQLNDRLPPDLMCRAEELVVRGVPEEPSERPQTFRPDDFVIESGGPFAPAEPGAGLALLDRAETFTMEVPPLTERWLEVRTTDDERVIASLEVLSPRNKSGTPMLEFRRKQRNLVASRVSIVEVDLLRRGGWAVFPDERAVPERYREPYRLVSTTAHGGLPRSTFSRAKLRDSLPPLPVPLRPGEPVAVLELQPLVDDVWRTGRYGGASHYHADPPPFPPDDAAWIADRVREWTERRGPAGSSPPADAAAGPADEPGPTGPPAAG